MKCFTRTTPPAQLRLKDAAKMLRRPCITAWGGRAPLYRASCPMRLFDHPIRRRDGDGKQNQQRVFLAKKS